ncbi:MAG: hypothetical protein ACYCVW_03565 [Rhodocyclaceae bacterium]
MACACRLPCRRSLTTAQRALIALGFLDYEKAEASKRQGTRTDLQENSPEGFKQARDKAGERMHISGKAVDAAAKVTRVLPAAFYAAPKDPVFSPVL